MHGDSRCHDLGEGLETGGVFAWYSSSATLRSACDCGSVCQWKGTKLLFGLTHDGLRHARIMNGRPTKRITPPKSTEYQTVLEPIEI